MIQSAKKARAAVLSDPAQSGQIEQAEFVEENIAILPTWKSLVFIIGGMIAIKFGGDFVVDGASSIASRMGLSQTLIGLTIVAMGTSLPELVTSLVAAKKGEVDMALGNVIGSDIFNILFVLGIATVISPISFLMENVIDIILLIIMSVIVSCICMDQAADQPQRRYPYASDVCSLYGLYLRALNTIGSFNNTTL